MKFLLPIVLLLLLAAPVAPAAPKEPPPPPPPPMAQAQTISIFRGRTVEIPLRAVGRTPGQLKFLIRTQPKHGKLGSLRVTGRKTAVVTYTHDNAASSSADSFTFAVQAADSPVSAPGEVRMVISEEPAAMAVVHAVDFGRIWLGETREEEIILQNIGGGILTGRISVPDPWKILGPPEYRLARRQQVRMRIAFEPGEARDYSGQLLFSHDSRVTVRLTGEAAPPFTFEPAREVELSSVENSLLRSGTLTIHNQTDRPRTLEITVPDEVITQDDLTISRGSEVVLKLQTKSDFFEALDGEIVLESEGFRRTIPLRVFAVRPTLTLTPKALNLGQVEAAQRVTRTMEIKNEGGADAHLRAETPSEILLIPDPNAVVLAPGETRKFEVAFEPQVPSEYSKELRFSFANGPVTTVPVTATVGMEKKPVAQATPPAKGVPKNLPQSIFVPTPLPREETPPPEDYNSVPKVEIVTAIPTSKHGLVEFAWAKPAVPVTAWVVEGRLWRDDKVIWDPWPRVKFREENDRVIARLENMPPGRYVVRLRALDGSGKKSEPSSLIGIAVPPKPKWHLFRWFVAALVIAGIIHLVRKNRARQKAVTAEEDKRIARLGPN